MSISQHINLDQILQELENIMHILLQQGVDPAGTISIKKNKNKNYKIGMKSSKEEEIKVDHEKELKWQDYMSFKEKTNKKCP